MPRLEPQLVRDGAEWVLQLVHEDNAGPELARFSSEAAAGRALAACVDVNEHRLGAAVASIRERLEHQDLAWAWVYDG